mmetsp:Transcript_5322/g.17105  ORF Transcript_5322/g.17105 Transcript_5322/m.17105 type:complete len:223 (+) Transcript_5322:1391-2059(+)
MFSPLKGLAEFLAQLFAIREHEKVLALNIVVGIRLPERRAKAEVVEHDAKGPQVVGNARLVLLQLLHPVDLARLVRRLKQLALLVGRLQQHPRHLGRTVAGARHLAAEGLAQLAEGVEVDELKPEANGDGIERLEVGVNALSNGVHVVERTGQVRGDRADVGPVAVGDVFGVNDVLFVNCVLEAAVRELQHDEKVVLGAGIEGAFARTARQRVRGTEGARPP